MCQKKIQKMFDACISHVICANEKVFYQRTLLENKRKLVLLLKNSYSTFSIKSAKSMEHSYITSMYLMAYGVLRQIKLSRWLPIVPYLVEYAHWFTNNLRANRKMITKEN